MLHGRKSREDRLTATHSGAWATSSQDYVFLATELYAHSARDASRNPKGMSPYVFAGLPILFAALRALLIECNSGIYGGDRSPAVLEELAKAPNELNVLRSTYAVPTELAEDLALLYEIRNEVVHPSHRPTGTPDLTPEYLRSLKTRGYLVTTGVADADYTWLAQLQSHALFRFSFTLIEQTAKLILERHRVQSSGFCCLNLASYHRFKEVEAPC